MNDLKKYCEEIQQAENQGIEKTYCKAIKFDDGFTNANNVVDYIEICGKGIVMIEMKDLQLVMLKNFRERPSTDDLKKLFDNIHNKFKNSYILAKKEISPCLISTCNYLVWKNNTDVNIMDKYLPTEFKKRPYQICKTNEICEKLNKLNPRICQ